MSKPQLINEIMPLTTSISLPNTTDFNTITEYGNYCISAKEINPPNNPINMSGGYWFIEVIPQAPDNSWMEQRVSYRRNGVDAPRIFHRMYTGSYQWSEWQEITTVQELNKQGIMRSIGTQDLNKCVKNGKYIYSGGSDVVNKPTNVYGYVDVTDWGNGYALQKVTDANGEMFIREMVANVWESWDKYAFRSMTVNPTLSNGWSVDSEVRLTKVGERTTVSGGIHGGTTSVNTVLFTLPIGYRPYNNQNLVVPTIDSSYNISMIELRVQTDGIVKIHSAPSKQYIKLNLNF